MAGRMITDVLFNMHMVDEVPYDAWATGGDNALAHMREPVFIMYSSNHVWVSNINVFEHPWCGFCARQEYYICAMGCRNNERWVGYGCEHDAKWCGLCVRRVVAWCNRGCRTARLMNVWHHARYLELLTSVAGDYVPCSWCAMGAGTYCKACDTVYGPACAMCRDCDNCMKACRLCWALHYVRDLGRPCVRVTADRRRALRDGRYCMVCGEPATKMCEGCRLMRYCSGRCQRRDWQQHKVFCRKHRGAVRVFWYYEWHRPVIDTCQVSAIEDGGQILVRFLACFGGLLQPS